VAEELANILDDAEEAVAKRDTALVLELCADLHYADLATLYENLANEERNFLSDTLGAEKFSEVLAEIPDTLVEEALDHFQPEEQREILESIPDDDRVDILQDVSEKKRGNYINLLDDEKQSSTRTLLRYGEDTAGGRMTTQIGKVLADMTVKEAIDHLRGELESTETLARIFVIDEIGKLIGKIRLRDLAFNPWDTPIRDLLTPEEHYILATTDQEEAANMFARYDMLLLPVVDESDRLLGVITADDAIEILEEESTEDFEKGAGISGEQSEETYLNTPVLTHFRRRSGWLIALALLAIASGIVMYYFEGELAKEPLLMIFLPMVVAAGGNTGGQASTMVIRAMALGELNQEDSRRVAWKELRLGMMLGGLLAVIITLVAMFGPPAFDQHLKTGLSITSFAYTVGIALGLQVMTSTLIGALLPIGARKIKLDPAVIASPAITTIVDVSGMVIYFIVASSIFFN